MALNGGGSIGLGFELSATDGMSAVFAGANSAVSKLHEGLTRLGAAVDMVEAKIASVGMAVFNMGKGFLEGAFKLAESGAPFEQAMHEVQYWSNATEDQMRDMNEAVFSAQNALLGFTATDSAKALKELAVETGNAQEALDHLEPALLLAGITGRSAEQGAKQLGQALRVFNIEGKDAGETVDRIAVASKQFHVEAGEMSEALLRTARGAKVMGASMTDAAITLGIMRSGSRTMSESAMAVNMAMMRMGDAKVATALEKIAPGAKDAAGSLQPLPIVLGLIADNTKKLTLEEQKNALSKAFGQRAAGDMLRAVKDLSKGVVDQEGHVLKGSEAVKYYYEQMQKSEGAARKMRDALLDTFAGQEKVLKAAVESLKTGLAAPLAAAFKPVVSALAQGLAQVVEFFAKIDPETKKFMAQATLLAGVLVTVLGAAFVFLGGPATVAIFALIAAGAALYEAYRSNLGGFADWVNETIGRVTLAFRALSSLFSKGGLSLELFEALEADPALKNFVAFVFVSVNRIKHFWDGLVEGFQAGVARAGPVFDRLGDTIHRVAVAFGLVAESVDVAGNTEKLSAAGSAGQKFGDTLARVAEGVAKALTIVAQVMEGVGEGFSGFGPIADGVSEAFNEIKEGLNELMGSVGDGGDGWKTFGHIIGEAISLAVSIIGPMFSAMGGMIRGVLNIWSGVVKVVQSIIQGDWHGAWDGAKQVVYGFVSAILAALRGMVAPVQAIFKALHIDVDLGAALKSLDATLKDSLVGVQVAAVGADKGGAYQPGKGPLLPPEQQPFSVVPTGAFPAGAEAEGRGAHDAAAATATADAVKAVAAKPTVVTTHTHLHLDGQEIAHSVTEHQAADAAGRGVPQANPV